MYPEKMRQAWISTQSALPFHPFGDDPDEIRIKDIARGLATSSRWRGQFTARSKTRLLSIAQHSVHVKNILHRYDTQTQLLGLLHDAPEWVFGDMPSPVKAFMPEYQRMEDAFMQRIIEKYHIDATPDRWAAVHAADKYSAYCEGVTLMPDHTDAWWRSYVMPTGFDLDTDYQYVHPWTPAAAERAFLAAFRSLTKGK